MFFTKDIRKKKSPYFSAVASLKLSISDFDKESIFSLFIIHASILY